MTTTAMTMIICDDDDDLFNTEKAAALGGPRIKLSEHWSQLRGPQSQVEGPRGRGQRMKKRKQ